MDNHEQRRYANHPLPAIGVVIWQDEKTLIIRRKNPPGQGKWGLVGGVQEWGETHFEAAMREAKEEADIEIKPFAIVTAIDGISKDNAGAVEYHYSIVEVNAEYQSGVVKAQSDILDAQWVTLPELESMGVWSEMLRVVKLAHTQYIEKVHKS